MADGQFRFERLRSISNILRKRTVHCTSMMLQWLLGAGHVMNANSEVGKLMSCEVYVEWADLFF
ncbi:hypothetical protein OROMI_003137 [Orobanche minor]